MQFTLLTVIHFIVNVQRGERYINTIRTNQ